jgi:hypothetical protein
MNISISKGNIISRHYTMFMMNAKSHNRIFYNILFYFLQWSNNQSRLFMINTAVKTNREPIFYTGTVKQYNTTFLEFISEIIF